MFLQLTVASAAILLEWWNEDKRVRDHKPFVVVVVVDDDDDDDRTIPVNVTGTAAVQLSFHMFVFDISFDKLFVRCNENPAIEELRLKLLLPATEAYKDLLQELHKKKGEIWEKFYVTDAMTSREWTEGGYELRHTVTRLAVHGFHLKLCNTKSLHDPGPQCICARCGEQCARYEYHVLEYHKPTTTQAIESTTEDMTSTQISTPSSYITTHFTTNEETTQYVTSEVQLSTTLKPSTNQESTTSQSTVLYSTLQPTTTSKGTTTEDATDYEQLTTDSQLTITTSETRTTEERTTSISTTVTQLHTTTLRPTETMVTDRPTTSEFITATEESTLTEQTSDITTLFTSTTSTTNTSSFQTTLLPVTESVGTTEDIKRKPYKPDHLVLSAIESDGTCRDDQTPMVIPDLNSLITAVDHSVSKESLNTVVNYIEKNNLANLMADFNTDIDIDFTKRSKLLGDILKHIKLKHLKDNPTVLHSVDHVLSKLSSEEDEELLPEYYFVCRNNSGTETTTMSQLSPFPSTTVKINKQPRITPEYFPTAATFPQTVTTTESEQIFTATTLSTEPTIETDLMSTTESLISIETEELSTISATTSSAETTTTQKIMSTTTESLNTSESEEISTTLRTTYPVTTTEAEIMDTTTESIISTTESEKMPTSQTTIFSETSTKQNEMSTTTKIKETILSTTTTEHILMSTTISSETPTEHEDILTTTEIEETTLPTTTTEHMLTSTISSE
ncbi:hypothetical protein C0J52_20892, partial [Blattella germanica]